jgi:hypothetical protein
MVGQARATVPFPARPGAAGWSSAVADDRQVVLAAAGIAGLVVLGMSLGVPSLTILGVLAACLAAVITPAVGLAVLAFTCTLQPPDGVPAPGFVTLLVGATLLGCVYRLPIDRPVPRANAALLLLAAFVFFVTVQQLPEMASGYAGSRAHDVGYLYFQLLTGFGLVVAAIWVLHGRSPYPVIVMGMAGATLAAAVAVLPYLAPGVVWPLENLAGPRDDFTRANGVFSNPNYMGASAAVSLAGAAALVVLARSTTTRFLMILSAALIAGAALLSLSRGAFVAAFFGVAWLLLARDRRAAILVGGLGILGLFVLYPAFVEWRLVSLTGSASETAFAMMAASDEGRLAGLLGFVPLFLSSPLVGVGFGQYLTSNIAINQVGLGAHNWYGNVLAEQGVVGIVLWLLFVAAVILALRQTSGPPRTLGVPVFAALLTGCLFLEAPTSFQTVALPSLLIVAALAADWRVDGGASGEGITVSNSKLAARLRAT